jgi:hypothetical protein
MSGGHYDYQYNRLNDLADEIEHDFINDGVQYKNDGDHEYDMLSDATKEESKVILAEVRSLILDLRNCAIRARAIEWLTSADYGSTSYIEHLREKGCLKNIVTANRVLKKKVVVK